jgi:hypothetical protein
MAHDDDSDILNFKPTKTPTQSSNVVDQAVAKYPRLKSLNPAYVQSNENPNGYMLEHWGPNDTKYGNTPRPKELPLGRIGIQVFNPKTTADDVAGDIVSHRLVNIDPEISGTYKQFKSSLTPKQKDFLRGDYEEEVKVAKKSGSDMPGAFDEWLDRVGTPAALRGYAFNQYNPRVQKEFGYSEKQKELLNKIKTHISSPAKADDSDILNFTPKSVAQPKQGTPENPIMGFISRTGKAIHDYATGQTQEIGKNPKGAANAAAAGGIKGVGQFGALPVGLINSAMQYVNPEGWKQAVESYPPLKKAIQLSQGVVTNPQYRKETKNFPYSEATGATAAPMALPLYDMTALGAKMLPVASKISNPLIREALHTYAGALPLSATLAVNANINRPPGSKWKPEDVALQTATGALIPPVLHTTLKGATGGYKATENVSGKVLPKPEGLKAQEGQLQQPTPLPASVKKIPLKINNKAVELTDPYEQATLAYWKKPISKGGQRARRWLEQNHPAEDTQYKNDGAKIEAGIKTLAEKTDEGVLKINKGEAQAAHENKVISKDRDVYEKKQAQQDKEYGKAIDQREKELAKTDADYASAIDKSEKAKQAAEDKANALHEKALDEADKFKQTALRKEEFTAWKEYDQHKLELDKANDEYDKFRASEQAQAKKQQTQLEAQKAKEDKALEELYPQREALKQQGLIDETDFGNRQSRLEGARRIGKPVDINKFDLEEKSWLKGLADRKRLENTAEEKYEIGLRAVAQSEGLEIPETTQIVSPGAKNKAKEETGVSLEKIPPAFQTTPHEGANLAKEDTDAITSAVLKGGTKSDNLLKKLHDDYQSAQDTYSKFRDSIPRANSKKTLVQHLQSKIGENEYVEHANANLWNKPGGFKAVKGLDELSADRFRDYVEADRGLKESGPFKNVQRTTDQWQTSVVKGLKNQLATKLPSKVKQRINNSLDAIKGVVKEEAGSGFPGADPILKTISWAGEKTSVEAVEAKMLTVTEEDIFKRNNPELAQKFALIDAQDSMNIMGVKAPKTPQQKQAFYKALKAGADEDEIAAGEGIYGSLDKSTRDYLLQARISREQKVDLVNDALEKHFGNQEGEVEAPDSNWYRDPNKRYFRALQVAKALNGGAPRESALGQWGDRIAGNLQEAILTGKQSMHVIHVLEGFMTNFSNHPLGTSKAITQMTTSPQVRELLGMFDFGGPLKTRFTEHEAEADIAGDVDYNKEQSNILMQALQKAEGNEKFQNFKDVVQSSYLEKNFKVALTRTVSWNQSAKDLGISFDKLVDLMTREGKGETLSDPDMEKVLYAHMEMAQYCKDTVGFSNPALRSGDVMDFLPLTEAGTVFISNRQRIAHLTNSYLPRAAELLKEGDVYGAVGKIRSWGTWQALNIAINGAKGIGVGTALVTALGLKAKDKKLLDDTLNKCAIIGNTFNHYIPDIQPQGSPIMASISPGFVGIAIQAYQTLHDGFWGLGPFTQKVKNAQQQEVRNSENFNRFMKAGAMLLAAGGWTTVADLPVGIGLAAELAASGQAILKGKKNEMYYDPYAHSHMKTQVNQPTNIGEEVGHFFTKAQTAAFMQVQQQMEREFVAHTKIWWGALSNTPGYKRALNEGNTEAKKADLAKVKEMDDLGRAHNSPAHAIGRYTEEGTHFSWDAKLRKLEAQ